MAKILLDHSDGHYSTRLLSDEEAAAFEAQGSEVAHVEDHVFEAWHRHCEQEGVWQTLWRVIDNERYVRRRERELQPLEDAEREIRRLKEELERSKRMETFYEERYVQNLSERHREEWIEFTCVYPTPGCQLDALPFPSWQEHADHWHRHEAGFTRQQVVLRHFTDVVKGDATTFDVPADHALMLCWPPYDDDMAARALTRYQGDRVIYVGEGAGGCTGNDAFHAALAEQWDPIAHYEIPQWDGIHDGVHVYARKATMSTPPTHHKEI